jgi:hypothetical protein
LHYFLNEKSIKIYIHNTAAVNSTFLTCEIFVPDNHYISMSVVPDTTDLVYYVDQPAAEHSLGTYTCVAVSPTYAEPACARADIEAIWRLTSNINIIQNDCDEVSRPIIVTIY